MKDYFFLLVLLCLPWQIAAAEILASYTLKDNTVCSTDKSLIIFSGYEAEKLSGIAVNKISLLSIQQHQAQAISFQVDQKDAQGRYILSNHTQATRRINAQDELVFKKQDLGEQLNTDSELVKHYSLLEIKVASEQPQGSGWIYIVLGEQFDTEQKNKSILYTSQQDTVSSSVYKMAFAQEKPFLLDSFQWNLSRKMPELSSGKVIWGSNITDTMKIRHVGRFLGFSFRRTDDDYFSRLVAVKEGPLRIIRRTENKVKVLWKLKSPALYIDYVMMPDGFVMDSMVDVPFKISFFFSDLITITTMDWNNAEIQDSLHILSDQADLSLLVDGKPTKAKADFNKITGRDFSVQSKLGTFVVNLDIPEDFPIESQLYLRDDLNAMDDPENYPGQFGNVGFKTTGWENIDSKLYHLRFTVCVAGN